LDIEKMFTGKTPLLLYLAVITAAWLFHWARAPAYLSTLIDGRSYIPGRLKLESLEAWNLPACRQRVGCRSGSVVVLAKMTLNIP
jgi:hypothetical protein